MSENIMIRARDIHQRNVTAGWWSDLKSGKSILLTRNRTEMLMLTVSELSEANEAEKRGAKDDKLTQHDGLIVELGDAVIRQLDLIGAEESIHGEIDTAPEFLSSLIDEYFENVHTLMDVVDTVSAAMEFYRKGRIQQYRGQLFVIVASIFVYAEQCGYDEAEFWAIIDDKLAYNANREDHKIENRQRPDGKQF